MASEYSACRHHLRRVNQGLDSKEIKKLKKINLNCLPVNFFSINKKKQRAKQLESIHLTYMPVADIIKSSVPLEICIWDGGVLILTDESRMRLDDYLPAGAVYDKHSLLHKTFASRCPTCAVLYRMPLTPEKIEQVVKSRRYERR